MSALLQLQEHGQSYWLDNLTRGMLVDGELARRVETEGLRGVTSNPAIFHNAITRGALEQERRTTGAVRRRHLPLHRRGARCRRRL